MTGTSASRASEPFPLLTASYVRVGPDRARLRERLGGFEHEIVADSTLLDALERFLLACDGNSTCSDVHAAVGTDTPLQEAVAALFELGVLVDSRACSRYALSLVGRTIPTDSQRVERAYALERWSDGRFVSASGPADAGQPPSRVSSMKLEQLLSRPDSGRDGLRPSTVHFRQLLSAMYGSDGDHKPVPSAGAMWPLALHGIVGARPPDDLSLAWFDDNAHAVRSKPLLAIDRDELRRCFTPNELVDHCLEMGASMVVVSADVARVGLKYGTRGTEFALIEAGAAMQRAYEHALQGRLSLRAMGGIRPTELQQVLGLTGIVPVLVMLVATASDGAER